MPTETTFHNAAQALDQIAVGADELLHPTDAAFTPDVLSGGRFTTDVRRAIDRTAATAGQVAEACRNAAAECRRRADACRAYAHDVQTWEATDERYAQALRLWQGRQLAHVDDPLNAPAPGARPASPGPRPQAAYGWIG